jgi:N-formylglutamate amidohydrolase
VPHASTRITPDHRAGILLADEALTRELVRMTDWHTDRLFEGVRELGATIFVNELSRLVVDPERFADEDAEPMDRIGQGAVYTRTSDGAELRRLEPGDRQRLIDEVYSPYHAALTEVVDGVLDEFGQCLVLDCHSFGTIPLPSEADQSTDRPDICIGTDAFHTPPSLAERYVDAFAAQGFSTEIDRPFTGALVPLRYYGQDRRVTAVMVEVRRGLYCDEATGEPLPDFEDVQAAIRRSVSATLDPAVIPEDDRPSF